MKEYRFKRAILNIKRDHLSSGIEMNFYLFNKSRSSQFIYKKIIPFKESKMIYEWISSMKFYLKRFYHL